MVDSKIDLRRFYVKNIPESWDEWKLFSVFFKFGLVDNVNLGKTIHGGFKYGFVAMIEYDGAERLRSVLANGRLNVDGASLIVKAQFRQDKAKECENETKKTKTKPKSDPSKSGSAQPNTSYKVPHGDLPIGHKEIPIAIVETPKDFAEVENRMVFYVRVKDRDEKYEMLQKKLDTYVTSRAADGAQAKEGDSVIVIHEKSAARARIISRGDATRVYLVDLGVEVVAKDLWMIKNTSAHASLGFHLPQFVIECELIGVKFNNQTSIQMARQLIDGLCDSNSKVEIRAIQREFRGPTNLIQIVVEYNKELHEIQDFGTLLAERGLGSYQQPREVYSYTREELVAFKEAMTIVENDPLKEILQRAMVKLTIKA